MNQVLLFHVFSSQDINNRFLPKVILSSIKNRSAWCLFAGGQNKNFRFETMVNIILFSSLIQALFRSYT